MAVVVVAASVSAVAAPASPAAQDVPPGLIPEGDWTEEQVSTMLDMIDEAERVLPETFPASGTAEEITAELESLGFRDIGVVSPDGYWHFINQSWIVDEHVFDPEYAESLVYHGSEDHLQLVATMYFYPAGSVDDVPAEHAWLPGWHTHPELCFGDNGRIDAIIDPATEECPEGTTQANVVPMMHVWIVDNECGHRFGGFVVAGLYCDEYGGGHDHDGVGASPDGESMPDGGATPGALSAPPAAAVVAEPSFAG